MPNAGSNANASSTCDVSSALRPESTEDPDQNAQNCYREIVTKLTEVAQTTDTQFVDHEEF
jgi:hypothetical protein